MQKELAKRGMKFFGLILAIVVIVFISSCSSMHNKLVTYSDEGFFVKYPNNLTVEKRTPVQDFNIYTFRTKNKVVVSMYLGNAPSFDDKVKKGSNYEKGNINGMPFEAYTLKNDNGSKRKDVLLTLSGKQDWPKFIHFWYSDLSVDLRKTAEEIIASTRR